MCISESKSHTTFQGCTRALFSIFNFPSKQSFHFSIYTSIEVCSASLFSLSFFFCMQLSAWSAFIFIHCGRRTRSPLFSRRRPAAAHTREQFHLLLPKSIHTLPDYIYDVINLSFILNIYVLPGFSSCSNETTHRSFKRRRRGEEWRARVSTFISEKNIFSFYAIFILFLFH